MGLKTRIPFYYFSKFGPELMIFNMSIYTIKSVNQFTNNLSDYYVNLLKSWISIKYTKVPSYCNFITIRQEIIYIYIKNKNLTAQRSNSNTAWLNFQTYIIFSINLV